MENCWVLESSPKKFKFIYTDRISGSIRYGLRKPEETKIGARGTSLGNLKKLYNSVGNQKLFQQPNILKYKVNRWLLG